MLVYSYRLFFVVEIPPDFSNRFTVESLDRLIKGMICGLSAQTLEKCIKEE